MTGDPAFRAWVAGLPPAPGRIRVAPGIVATVTIDHPETRNALAPHMMVAFADAISEVRGARVVILSGEGGTFCSGGNLGAVQAHLVPSTEAGRPSMGAIFGAFMQAAVDALAGLDAVVIAAAEGAAMGGGAELLTAADIVVAAPTARVGFVHARLGVSPGFGGGGRLVARVGAARALRILAFAEVLSAEEALAAGIVDELAAAPLPRAEALAARLCLLPEAAVRGAKRVVHAAAYPGEARQEELAVFAGLWGGPDHLRALESKR